MMRFEFNALNMRWFILFTVLLFFSDASGLEKKLDIAVSGLFVIKKEKGGFTKIHQISDVKSFDALFPQLNVNGKWDLVLKFSKKNRGLFEEYRKRRLRDDDLFKVGFYFNGKILTTHEMKSGKVFPRIIKLQGFEEKVVLQVSKCFSEFQEGT